MEIYIKADNTMYRYGLISTRFFRHVHIIPQFNCFFLAKVIDSDHCLVYLNIASGNMKIEIETCAVFLREEACYD
jgi:hypothetical protein